MDIASEVHSRAIWEWRNDPTTQKMFRHGDPVPWESHQKWFSGKLEDPDTIILVDEQMTGMARFDRIEETDIWETSVNLNPEFRGRKLSVPFFSSAIDWFEERYSPKSLSTEIRTENIPSIKMFTRCGYDLVFRQPGFGIYVRPGQGLLPRQPTPPPPVPRQGSPSR